MNIEISPKEYEKRLNWNDAIFYCQLLTIDNKNDWRLPTRTELNNIWRLPNDLECDYYWSITESSVNGGYAWYQHMASGAQHCDNKNDAQNIRPIRSLTTI